MGKELSNFLIQIRCDLSQGKKKGHLTVPKRVQHLAIVGIDAKDCPPVRQKANTRQMLVKTRLFAQIYEGLPDALKGHASLQ